ncbi:hypothetical protein UFOVP75_18 [uncultured Caudovirales phage]|uniref:Uncharacterized protein n=1 Tax=uncultured Caudovirales phage TaxID=2100421 RepID=A0A6J5KW27_9CAUD|nr:hypothetical protein UFOVP75_18 [uncultured Caudovirales phage]
MTSQNRKNALVSFLDVNDDDVYAGLRDEDTDPDEDTEFDNSGKTYLVLTDDEANKRARDYIEQSLWAFRPEFIVEHTDLPCEATEMVAGFCQAKCEDANDTIRALIKDLDAFVQDAINADGRGHFMSSYDGQEHEHEGFYIYRTN